MKHLVICIVGLLTAPVLSQVGVYHYGGMQLHDYASVGFHSDLVNHGTFDQNLGTAGFYSDYEQLSVTGSLSPVFHDLEIAVEQGLLLEVPIGVNNNSNLIVGDIITTRTAAAVYSNFLDYSFYTGESSISKVNGYAAITNKESFMFPVGDDERLRPLTVTSIAINAMAKCAYFFEDPNNSKSLNAVFSTDKKSTQYMSVSDKEFWRLEGDVPSRVTLTWDELSNIAGIAEYTSDLNVMGWSKAQNQWVNLGNTGVEGGRAYGSVTSDSFVPNEYEILTIGGNDDALQNYDTLELDNYFLTPNGDGRNDVLRLEGIERSPSNSLQIFNRYGVLVYKKDNYQNDFDGRSNMNMVIERNSGLENGVYFYIITLHNLRKKHQGYMYISN
jgi:gliding motility-associated-like protein